MSEKRVAKIVGLSLGALWAATAMLGAIASNAADDKAQEFVVSAAQSEPSAPTIAVSQ